MFSQMDFSGKFFITAKPLYLKYLVLFLLQSFVLWFQI